MAQYTKCPDCGGSIPSYTGLCVDCGFDLAEFCNEVEIFFDSIDAEVPVEAYQEIQVEMAFDDSEQAA